MLTYNVRKVEVHAGSKEVEGLTPKERSLLRHLIEADGGVLSREQLRALVWKLPDAPIDTRTVDQHVARLRQKLGKYGSMILVCEGYKLKGPAKIVA